MSNLKQTPNMKLEDFISESIKSIVIGIKDANKKLAPNSDGQIIELNSEEVANKRHIEFDVAVSAIDTTNASVTGNARIKVWGFFDAGVGAKTGLVNTNSTISRLRFGVRIKKKEKI